MQEDGENYMMRNSIICAVPQIRLMKSRGLCGGDM